MMPLSPAVVVLLLPDDVRIAVELVDIDYLKASKVGFSDLLEVDL